MESLLLVGKIIGLGVVKKITELAYNGGVLTHLGRIGKGYYAEPRLLGEKIALGRG